MDKKTKRTLLHWIMLPYCLYCLSPYFISALNQIEPKLLGFPFTVWPFLLIVVICCFYLNYMSKVYWDSYDPQPENDDKK
ncbi:hypothetical protein AGMMS50276_17190 [Synergistales bacterium]|nr:hypothetical protein AGMMS50276_17190 [Synergistales bacterium]